MDIPAAREPSGTAPGALRRVGVPFAVALAPVLTVLGGFTTTRIFYVRDLSSFFWPWHLWLRRTIASGHLPLWNPDSGFGYPAASDPVTLPFFLPTLPLRLPLPDALGFNAMVVF